MGDLVRRTRTAEKIALFFLYGIAIIIVYLLAPIYFKERRNVWEKNRKKV